ncbi:MAG: hypothetical protein IJ791_07890, partial [Lachnospiraceae bacterium]|nr:hypothetical protein [Lachnospiraceae bacterium]
MKTKRILASALVVLFLSQTVASDIYATAFGMGKVYAAEEDVAETQAPAEAEETPLVIVETGANESEKEQVVADEIGSSETAQVEESIGEETTVAETEATVEEETLETEETVETEETEETEESVKSVYTYSGNGVTVTATLSSPDVIPDDAIFRVTPITSGTAYNAYMAAMDKADPEVKHDADNTVLFDVAFLVQDESGKLVEFEPEQGTVRIQITFTQKQLEKIDAKNEETKIVHLPLKDSVKDRVDTTLDAGSITVNDILPEVLTETKANGETLNFTMDSFSTVGATLATAYKQTSFTENLNELVKDVTIQASKDENGNLIVNPDNSYKIALRFEEKPNELEFDNTKVIYTFPDGINPAYAKDTFEVDLGGGKVLKENTYEIKDGKIYVTWNQKDSNYATFIASSQAWFELTADAKVSKFSELISFGTDVDKQYTFVQDKGNASIEKSGWLDESNGIIYYTITVKSQGKVKNVKVTDTVKGSLVQYDKNTVTVNGAPAGTRISHNSKGFTYTIPELSGNQTVTITYSAKVDMSKIDKDGKLVLNRDNTLNTVSLEGDDLPKQTDEYYVSKEMNYTSLDKSGSSSVNGNQAIITWTITANEKMQANMAGQTITDRLPYEGNNKMSNTMFYGNGVKVEAYSGNNRVYTKTLTWSELGIDPNKQATQTWSYKIPNNDQKYKYVFTYQTVSDLTNLVGSDKWSIKNEVTDTFGNKDTEKIEFTPGKDQKTKLIKTGYKQSDNKGNWTITFTVPASGLSSCILDDILPNAWVADALRSDKLDRNSLKVTGLTTGESYDFEEIYVENERPGFRLTFKKNGQSGLKDTGKSRTITVAYTTTPDSNWLDKATKDWQARHVNTAKLYANNIETEKDADIYYPKAKSFDKQGHLEAMDGKGKPVYAYDLILTGVDQDTVVIEDTFDTSLFTTQGVEHYNVWGGKIFGADWNVPNLHSANQYFTSMVPTATGVKITANVPKRADGTYYSNYKLVYFVTTKDDAALKKLQENAAANNGKTVVRNKATWEGLTDQLDLEYEFNPLKKNGEVVVKNGKNTDQVKFTLTINTAGVDLDPNSDTVELLDKCTNLTILPEEVKTTPNVAVTFDRTSDGYKFVIPDATALTLEYTCEINHLDGSQATWSNTASLKGYKVDTSGSYEVYTSGAKGGAKNPGITVVKHAKGDLGHTLNGATFRLLDADRNPVYNNRDQEVTITTTKDGSARLIGDSYNLGWTLLYGKQYYLEETVAPDGYVAEGTLIPFVISETDRNGTTLFKDGDSLYVANEERQYSPVQVGLNASKTLTGRDILSDEFSFTLSAKNETAKKVLPTAQTVSNKGNAVGFENIEFNEPGTYTFDIAEVIPASADKVKGVTYDEAHHTATVVVTAGQNGSLEAKVTYDNGQSAAPTFTNTYKAQPTSAQFDVVKTLSGRSMAQWEFEFELLENGTVIDTVKAPAATMTGDVATSAFKFNAIEYSQAGKHTYTIREKLPNGAEAFKDGVTYDVNEVTVVVDVQDDGNGNLTKTVTYTKAGQSADQASFANSYTVKEGEAYLHVRKELTGRDLRDGDFTFEVRDETNKVIRT